MSGSYQLSPFEVGQVKAHMEHDLGSTTIARHIKKADGKSFFEESAIRKCMKKLKENPGWRGEREEGSGAPRKTTTKQDKQIIQWVMDERGKQKVSVSRLKKQFPVLRCVSDSLVEDRLHDANLAFLRRVKKTIVAKKHRAPRISYCRAVKRMHTKTLQSWAYTDGTVYYLDKTEADHEHTVRRALGTHVWRKSDNSDARWGDCVGPSVYNKAQGIPVRVWGMLASGVLNITVLEEGEVMDTTLYVELIEDSFDDWRFGCDYLVCDYEGCLRSEAAVDALERIGMTLVPDYPMFPKTSTL